MNYVVVGIKFFHELIFCMHSVLFRQCGTCVLNFTISLPTKLWDCKFSRLFFFSLFIINIKLSHCFNRLLTFGPCPPTKKPQFHECHYISLQGLVQDNGDVFVKC
jgi:hypothetical protein